MTGRVEQYDRADAWARRLSAGDRIEAPVALVVAHADDETLWAGSGLIRFSDLRIVHATDGAPRDMADAARLGLGSRAAYARLRAAELDRALALLGAEGKQHRYDIVDQEVAFHLRPLVDRLTQDLADCEVVITHPFEGGHPDHDSLALAVRMAADRLGQAPAIVEFACYASIGGERQFGRFWPDPSHPEHQRPLTPDERTRVGAAIDAHASQAGVVGGWRPVAERWRAAPTYDFTAPPPPGVALYDGFGWSLTSARWRELAREAITAERAGA